MLLIRHDWVHSIGFQLSAVATAGLTLSAPGWNNISRGAVHRGCTGLLLRLRCLGRLWFGPCGFRGDGLLELVGGACPGSPSGTNSPGEGTTLTYRRPGGLVAD